MEVIFLGSGGGRVVLHRQIRATGGFIVREKGVQMHVDPGPGAIVRAWQYRVDPTKTRIIFVSHIHTDHFNDVPIMIECMAGGALKRRGYLVGSEDLVVLRDYYRNLVESVILLKPGDEAELLGLKLKATRCMHDEDLKVIGFILEGEKKLGYTADTELFEGLAEQFIGCDAIIINCLRPNGDRWKGHMCSWDVAEFLKIAKPKLGIIQHFGMKMLRSMPQKEAAEIERRSGIKCIAARDGMRLEI